MTFNLGSLLLAILGMMEILFSFLIAIAFWCVFMQQPKIDFFQQLGIFMILCIGADDLFVYHDTWKLSANMSPSISDRLDTRFAWTFKHAASAMFTTTATTVGCLLLSIRHCT